MLRRNNNRVPDVLDCLANLSNDEVLTPPAVANKMLDLLPQEVFESRETTFLDPFTKSGVFLREITKRLLAHQVPDYEKTSNEIMLLTKEAIQNAVRDGRLDLNDADYEKKARGVGDAAIKASPESNRYLNFEIDLQDALDHILTKQVFGIAITELTAHLSRRSLYCSEDASGRYSVSGTAFGDNRDGNIRFVPTKHKWKNGTCIYCGASRNNLDRPDDFESHAYEFIHTEKVEDIYMGFQISVICGNPPYQLSDGGGTGDSAKPIYNKFIEQAKKLNPKYLVMIIPSRWMKGGKGLDGFRKTMMKDACISNIVDFENAETCFGNNVHIDGGVCYFLRDSTYNGPCHYIYQSASGHIDVSDRYLDNGIINTVIRDSRQVSLIEKASDGDRFSSIVSARNPYGFYADFFNRPEKYPQISCQNSMDKEHSVSIYGVKGIKGGAKRTVGYIKPEDVRKNNASVNSYKLFFSKAYLTTSTVPPEIIQAKPCEICTETFLEIGPFNKENEMINALSYLKTKFARALLFFNRHSLNISQSSFDLIPLQDFSKPWTDEELYAKYNLTDDEITFIESMIKPME